MTRKLKIPGALKKKSEMDNSDKKGKGKKHANDVKHDPHPQVKATSPMSVARQRWNMPNKVWDSTFANLRIQLNTVHKSGARKFKKPTGKINYCVRKLDKMARPEEVTYAVRRTVPGDMDTALWLPKRLDGLRFDNGLPVSHSILGTVADYLAELNNRDDTEIKGIEFRAYDKLPDIQPRYETGFRACSPSSGFKTSTPIPGSCSRHPDIKYKETGFQTSSDFKTRRPFSENYSRLPEIIPKGTGFPNSYSPLPDIKPRTTKKDPGEIQYSVRFRPDQENALRYWDDEQAKGRNLGKKISLKCKRSKDDLIMGNHSYKVSKGQKRVFDDLETAWQSECRITRSNGFWKQREQLGDNLRGIHMSRTKLERGINPESEVVHRPGSGRINQNDRGILDLSIKGGFPSSPPQIQPQCFNIPSLVVEPIPEIIISAINEPTIEIGQHVLSWSNRRCDVEVELGIVTCPGQAKMGNLAVKNISACVVRFEIFKIPKTDPFNISNPTNNRDCIFLGDREAIVLPNDYQNISAIFHSHRATTCSEKWRIETTPRLARDITLTIWGIAKKPKELGESGEVIEEELQTKILYHFMENMLIDIIEKVCCVPPTVRTEGFPGDMGKWFVPAPVANDLFTLVNPGLTYHSGTISKILEIREISLPDVPFNTWSLPLNDIRLSVCDLPEEVTFKNNAVTKNEVANVLMTYVCELSYDVNLPMATRKYDMCKKLLVDLCTNICDTATRLKKIHGITLDMDFSIDVSKDEFLHPPVPEVTVTQTKGRAHTPKTPSKTPPKTPSQNKSRKKSIAKGAVPVIPQPGSIRLGKIARGIHSAKQAQYKNRARPIMYLKYLEKLNTHAIIIVRHFVDQCADYLSDLPEVPKLRL